MNEKIAVIIGNALSALGVCISVEQLDKVSIIITTSIAVIGFIISVVIPKSIKLYNKIKAAKADGKITNEEIDDICKDAKEIIDDIDDQIKK